MPELPEVETVRRALEPKLAGRRLARVLQRRPDLRFPFPEGFVQRLEGATVRGLRRRAKYLLADLDTGDVLLIHLGMSGRLVILEPETGRTAPKAAPVERETVRLYHEPPRRADSFTPAHSGTYGPHDHVVFELDDATRIVFSDHRRFGMMDLFPGLQEARHRLLASLGPEPLGNGFSDAHLNEALAGRRTPVKAALLDQRIVAGLGNIYVCEALHRAGISPRRLARTVPGRRAGRLAPAVRAVLEDAIRAGGSSLRDYVHTDGSLGYFQHAFAVYDREGASCRKPGCDGTIRRIVQAGRSSFYCNRCQR